MQRLFGGFSAMRFRCLRYREDSFPIWIVSAERNVGMPEGVLRARDVSVSLDFFRVGRPASGAMRRAFMGCVFVYSIALNRIFARPPAPRRPARRSKILDRSNQLDLIQSVESKKPGHGTCYPSKKMDVARFLPDSRIRRQIQKTGARFMLAGAPARYLPLKAQSMPVGDDRICRGGRQDLSRGTGFVAVKICRGRQKPASAHDGICPRGTGFVARG